MDLTPSQIKNLMRRGLRLLVDPEPTSIDREAAFLFFTNQCAYCGISTNRKSGDLDHLISASKGGPNHISNRVPACKQCNAHEKRDLDWEVFLQSKCPTEAIFLNRRTVIANWIKQNGAAPLISTSKLRIIDEQSRICTEIYEKAVDLVRRA